jgi:hypothetical protein
MQLLAQTLQIQHLPLVFGCIRMCVAQLFLFLLLLPLLMCWNINDGACMTHIAHVTTLFVDSAVRAFVA